MYSKFPLHEKDNMHMIANPRTLPKVFIKSLSAYFWKATNMNPIFLVIKFIKVKPTAIINEFLSVALLTWTVLKTELKLSV